MPSYEYSCNKCKKSFVIVLTLKEHEDRKVACPRCGSKSVKQKISVFHAVTSRKS